MYAGKNYFLNSTVEMNLMCGEWSKTDKTTKMYVCSVLDKKTICHFTELLLFKIWGIDIVIVQVMVQINYGYLFIITPDYLSCLFHITSFMMKGHIAITKRQNGMTNIALSDIVS